MDNHSIWVYSACYNKAPQTGGDKYSVRTIAQVESLIWLIFNHRFSWLTIENSWVYFIFHLYFFKVK